MSSMLGSGSLEVVALVSFIVFAFDAQARTLEVPHEYSTIQQAIAASSIGDTVSINCGVYLEHGLQMRSGIHLRSASGNPSCTTIDARRGGRVFNLDGIDASTIIEGITITGGTAFREDIEAGGAVYLVQSDLLFRNCVFTSNRAAGGGAIAAVCSNPQFEGCLFVENKALSAEVAFRMTCGFPFTSGAASDGEGGVALCVDSDLTFKGCVFWDNSAARRGAILAGSNSSAAFRQCTFAANSSTGSLISLLGALTLDRCLISHNGAPTPIVCTGLASISCTNIFNPPWGSYDSCIGDMLGTNGNISKDPLFCNLDARNLTLRNDSPCLPGNHPVGDDCGVIGALDSGCVTTHVENRSWSLVKSLYR